MSRKEAAEILQQHNEWRRGADIPMTDPVKLGQAIDVAVLTLGCLEAFKND